MVEEGNDGPMVDEGSDGPRVPLPEGKEGLKLKYISFDYSTSLNLHNIYEIENY